MKVVFKIIQAKSGNDIYFQRLCRSLQLSNIQVEIEYYSKFFQFFPWLLFLLKRKSKADIIHSNVEYAWAFKEKNIPLFVTLHHNVFDETWKKSVTFPQKIFYYLILKSNIRKSLKTADAAIAVSHYTKRSFQKTFGKYPITVYHNFIDTKLYKPHQVKSKDTRFKLLFVGNLTKRKGADLLPLIMNELGKEYVLYYTSGLRTKQKNNNVSNMVGLGRQSEEQLIKTYNMCDALLFPSRLEGFGYAIIEAMACGKPVITTNTSSLPELITEGENGFLCERDNISDFVQKIKYIRENKLLLKKMQIHNRAKAIKNFSLHASIERNRKIYKLD